MFNALRADNSPFSEAQIAQLQAGTAGLDTAQTVWLSGFIAGQLAAQSMPPLDLAAAAPAAQQVPEGERLQVFFASQTGNGEALAELLAQQAEQAGIAVEVQSLAGLRPAALKKLKYAAFVISTHGEGDPPDDAIDLFEYLQGPRAARLEQLQFSILALGDRSYSQFCEAGRQLETLLLAQGAKTYAERVECDVDYQQQADDWSAGIVRFGQENLAVAPAAAQSAAHLSVVPQSARWTRANPFPAVVERVQKITGLGSDKDVYHLEFSLEDSGLEYAPGDSLGVWAYNNHAVVDEVLTGLKIDAADQVNVDGHPHSIHELLVRHRELTRLSADTVRNYAEWVQSEALTQQFDSLDDDGRRAFIEARQFADLVSEFPPAAGLELSAEELSGLLRPLAPRSYSIASSQASVDEEVHLTVATLFSNATGQQRRGVASDFLNHGVQPGDEISVYLEPNRRFRLPETGDAPLIMIGAGTGVAPYRAFLQQLEADGSSAETWLIFGNPHLRTDFLYQKEWLEWRKNGLLTRIDCAFSRDQQDKHYVQNVVREQGKDVAGWLARGARVYICGGLDMGHEVEQALRDVLAEQQGLDAEQASEQVAELRRQGRLLKDLY